MSGSPDEGASAESVQIPDLLPVLPLKDVVLFPYVIVPLSVSREKSIAAVDAALAEQSVHRIYVFEFHFVGGGGEVGVKDEVVLGKAF